MRSTPGAPEAPVMVAPEGPEGFRYGWHVAAAEAWRKGWEAGFIAALRSVSTVQLELPTEDPWA